MKTNREIKTAKEIKIIFKLFILSLVAGLISFPILIYHFDGFANNSMKKEWESYYSRRLVQAYFSLQETVSNLDTFASVVPSENIENSSQVPSKDEHFDYYKESLMKQSEDLGYTSLFMYPKDFHEFKYREAIEKSKYGSISIFVIFIIGLIAGRYILLAAKWVNETSKE